ncbi:hypothetical protein B0T18DRAFT_365857 [Schizothecium vesticola]|uniref:NACHT domain-containing protein n=1 Tax=Schizothecium vesticola TaxID=314040 RepID=A0AA40K8J6_9PEZI|nr:hypothetical protein B0T18DRAFT_365857 [Schizothecium vesticola]
MATPDQLTRISTSVKSKTTRSFLSRTLTRRPANGEDQAQHDAPKGPLGLTTLSEPDPAVPVTADIVFVHGLNGGSQSTWSKDNRASHFWPKEWLPIDDAFHDVRIHSFGYPSGLAQESVLNVRDFSSSLLAAVRDSPSMNERMGGLVTKLAYILGRQNPAFKSVVDRVCSIFFLATPHQGAAIAQTLSNLLAIVPGSGARPFVNDLLPLSPVLQSINEDFPLVCGELQLFSFYETRPISLGLRKLLVVEKTNAVMNLANERRTLLDADHRTAAKYASPNESAYLAVRNALATVVSAQRSATNARKRSLAQEELAILNRFLGVSDAPEDDIMTLDSVRLTGSGEWLAEKSSYKAWRGTSDSSKNFLWLQGRPGAGKSVLAGRVINELRNASADCSFFFFQALDNTKATANACLRSLAWQMARLHHEIASRLLELLKEFEDGPIDKMDHQPVWRRIFLSGILKLRLDRPQFWVIDGMDECRGSADMVQFLLRAQEHWPLSIIVTCRDPVEIHLTTATNANIHTEAILDDDTKQDISLFVRSNMQRLPCPKSEQWPDSSTIASHIVNNSGGCFLWASLVCSELREVASEREIDQVLGSVPSDMDALYSRILEAMSNAKWGKDVAKAFIVWTTYAFRPLTTVEIQEPIEIETGGKISSNTEDVIAKCCGSFLFVDKYAKVQFIHLTAREFLIQKGNQTTFTVTKTEGHRRLAAACLQALTTSEMAAPRTRRLRSTQATWPATPFVLGYASSYLFQHLNHVSPTDSDIFEKLAKFLESPSLLCWIEFHARNGNLQTVYQAGITINSLLHRRAAHSPPLGLARGNQRLLMLEKWGDDLIYLVTKFGTRLRHFPKVIHHLIPAFAPADSAIRATFANPLRGISVHGLSQRGWDDCLTTITFPKGSKPNTVVAGPGYFAIGMMHAAGNIAVYDDSIFQEACLLHHGEPVWRLAFSSCGGLLASAGAKSVRIWSTGEGKEVSHFNISSLCLALAFAEEDRVLLVATRRNQVVVWDIRTERFYRDEPMTWTTDLGEHSQGRDPTSATFGTCLGLLSVNYKGQDIFLWDYIDERVFDVYEKETGSVTNFGSHKLGKGGTTVRATVFSQALGTHLLAAAYNDGDMYVYDTDDPSPIASVEGANTALFSSSPNGGTLAAVDSYGNLTLFDFETLRALYGVRFDTPIPLKGLVFTADSRRFIEIRGAQCRVWQPAVLLRTDLQEEEKSDTISASTSLQEVHVKKSDAQVVNISAIVCLQSSNAVFYAMEDGSVHVCDLTGETETQLLFVQTQGVPIHILAVDEDAHPLADARILADVIRRQVPKQRRTTWEVQEPLIENPLQKLQKLRPLGAPLKQIFVSGKHSRLFLCAETLDILFAISNKGGGAWEAQLPGLQTPRWAVHPTDKDLLVRMEDSGFGIYSWQKLEHIRSIAVYVEGTFCRLTPLNYSLHFITSSLSSDPAKAQWQLWNLQSLSTASGHPTTSAIPDTAIIEVVIGTFASRLVFYTTDSWIASFDIAQPTPESLIRHFFIPADWVSAGRTLVMGVGRGGEILFAKGKELAVVKRGLEGTEEPGGRVELRQESLQPERRGLSLRARVSEPVGGTGPRRTLGGGSGARPGLGEERTSR